MVDVSVAKLELFAKETLSVFGVSASDADIIWDSMLYADIRGKTTHGVARLPLYWKNIQAGTIDPHAHPSLVVEKGALAVFDAHNGFGQIAACHALDFAIEKAKTYGIAAAGVRNSNNFGAAGYYGFRAAHHGVACLIMANASPALISPGAAAPVLGTNPLCFSAPGLKECPPIVFDMAASVAARSKIRLAAKNGESIPEGWAVNDNGKPTTNPDEALAGALLPAGGAKGYGLALMVDVLSGLLTGSAFAGQVKPLSDTQEPSRNGHMLIVFDIAAFCSEEEYCQRYQTLVDALKESGDEVRLPGQDFGNGCSWDKATAEMSEYADLSISLSDAQYGELLALRDALQGELCK